MMENCKRIVVSAPYGNFYKWFWFDATYTLGTFTLNKRNWFDKPYGGKWFRFFWTTRYSFTTKSWINKIGLKNPGIKWLSQQVQDGQIDVSDKIISVYGWNLEEWQAIFKELTYKALAIELNCSCSNITKPSFIFDLFKMAKDTGKNIIVKIPPVFYQKIVEMAWEAGIKVFHACNTLPTPYGGLSGKSLLTISQGVVCDLRKRYPDMQIIGGGDITCKKDVKDYLDCGADNIAIATMLNNPLNWFKIGRFEHW